MLNYSIKSLIEYEVVASSIADLTKIYQYFEFIGEMGSGKTTLISLICKKLKIIDKPSSPTFSIVNEYQNVDNLKVFHFDFYRINSPEEALNIGIEEYFESDAICFMEWPEKIEALKPKNTVKIYILVENNEREIRIELPLRV